ncbi:EF-hand domain-containing member C2 [Chytriomyces hyalinus]|nr:EF-hand domain-containing member C2 [Chytriomyces hyalinus]
MTRVIEILLIYDDTNTVFGHVCHMLVHFYLSDGTVDIRKTIPIGRPTNSMFRCRCHLQDFWGQQSGAKTSAPENFFKESGPHWVPCFFKVTCLCDLHCDDFTKEYYRENYGLGSFDPARLNEYEEPVAEEPKHQPAR